MAFTYFYFCYLSAALFGGLARHPLGGLKDSVNPV